MNKALQRLARVLDPLTHQKEFLPTSQTLKTRVALFEDLREALRLTPKPNGRHTTAVAGQHIQEATAELRDIRKAVRKLKTGLKRSRPERGPAQDRRKAIDIILRHLEVHEKNLWGHVISLPPTPDEPKRARLVDRTNNSEEGWFHKMKRGERRRSGRKTLTQDLEHLPAAAALVTNLRCPDYVKLLCGDLENLPTAFGELDCDKEGFAKLDLYKDAKEVEKFDTISASLPLVDRKLVRSAALAKKILAAAQSRAPMVEVAYG